MYKKKNLNKKKNMNKILLTLLLQGSHLLVALWHKRGGGETTTQTQGFNQNKILLRTAIDIHFEAYCDYY